MGIGLVLGGHGRIEAAARAWAVGHQTPLRPWGAEPAAARAREKAEAPRGQVLDERDPKAVRAAALAGTRKAEAMAKAAAARDAYTVDTLIDGWTEDHLSARSLSYRKRVPEKLRRALKTRRAAPAGTLERTDAVRVLDAVKAANGPIAANRLPAEARACWGWAGMRWDELNLDSGTWSLPGSRTKNGQPHTIPLTAEAVTLLRTVPRRTGADVVFEGPRQTAVSGFGKVKARLDTALALVAAETGGKAAPWVLHDLRRTMATGLQRLGVRLEVTEAVLNHVSGSRSGIVGVYQRHGWEAEKAAALRAWTAHVLAAAEGSDAADNVVPLARRT